MYLAQAVPVSFRELNRISGSKDAVQFCGTPHQLMILLVDAVPGTEQGILTTGPHA